MKKDESPATRILLVDENRPGCAARKTILAENGYGVETAIGGEKAWEAFCSTQFDIVVVVTNHPPKGTSGFELIRRIRESNSPARVILLMGFLASSDMTKKNTGADELIAKSPSEGDVLLRVIGKMAARPRRRGPRSEGNPGGSKQARA